MKRQHPAALIGYTSKNFWLLLIPLVRGLASLRFDFVTWISGAGWDILIVTVMIAAAVIRWYFTVYEITDTSVKLHEGIIIRVEKEIPINRISAVTAEDTPLFRLFSLSRLCIDTDAATGSRTSADVTFLATSSERARLINLMSESLRHEGGGGIPRRYKVSKPALAVFSLFFSSAFSGTALIITAISGGTDIVGDQLSRDFINIVNNVTDAVTTLLGRLISGISPAGIGISIVIGAGFFISFIVNLSRYLSFTAKRSGRGIVITCGFITKRMYCIDAEKINMSDMRQNLLMKIFGITSVHVSCTGYGKRKNEMPVFVPVCRVKALTKGGITAMDMILPEFTRCDSYISPRPGYVWRFIWPGTLFIFAIIIGGFCGLVYFPHWHSLIAFLTVMLEIPAVWLLFVNAAAYCTNGFNITSDSVCARYTKGYQFHTVTVPLSRVAEIRITQTVFQRLNRSCDVHIYTSSEYIGSHKVSGIPIAEVQQVLRERAAG